MLIERKWAMPNHKTFKIKPIHDFIVSEIIPGVVIDPFANECSISPAFKDNTFITNDLDTQYNTTYHLDALEFLKTFDTHSVDMVLYDPPYSPRQVSECYQKMGRTVDMQSTQASYWGNQKKEIGRILKPGGKVLTFGWNSGGIGKDYVTITRILLVPHGGWHNDTICTSGVKI